MGGGTAPSGPSAGPATTAPADRAAAYQRLRGDVEAMEAYIGALGQQKGRVSPEQFRAMTREALTQVDNLSQRYDAWKSGTTDGPAPRPPQPPATDTPPGTTKPVDPKDFEKGFFSVPARGNPNLMGNRGPKVADVMSQVGPDLAPWVRSQILNRGFDSVTAVHETVHGLDSQLATTRNGRTTEGLYLGGGKATRVDNPDFKKSQIASFVPPSLRESRFNTYIQKQPQYEDRPFKVFEEWNCYVHETETAIDTVRVGKHDSGNQDAAKGSLEFTAYAFSAAMAAEKLDPEYFRTHTQFKDFLGYQGLRAMDAFREGSRLPQFAGYGQEKYLDDFRNSPDAAPLRDFIARNYGQDYLRRLLDGP